MKRIKFDMHENLLRSVIFEQAGSLKKAIQECLQNSIDAKANKIVLDIYEKGFIFTDNGKGMSKKDIESFFKTFGYSDKVNDETKIGRFGMGRGQVFSFGYTIWNTRKYKMNINVKKSLDFSIRTINNKVNGTIIKCIFYNPIDSYDVLEIRDSLFKYFNKTNDIEFVVNGIEVNNRYEIISNYSNDLFTVIKSDLYSNYIFDKNIFVKRFNSYTDYSIICNEKMRLNFARNSFLEYDDKTKELNNLIKKIEKTELLDMKSYDSTLARHILELISNGTLNKDDFNDKPILEMSNGSFISFDEIKNKKIYFGYKDKVSDTAIQEGYTVLSYDNKWLLINMVDNQTIREFEYTNVEIASIVKKGYHITQKEKHLLKLGTKCLKYYRILKKFNNEVIDKELKRELRLGKSDVSDAWTDGMFYNVINLNIFHGGSKEYCLLKAFECLIHEYSHNRNDYENECLHDNNFYTKYNSLVETYLPLFADYLLITLREVDIL